MASPIQSPIQIHIEASLGIYNITLSQYLRNNPQYDRLVVSAFIFDAPKKQTPASDRERRLLIVQRAAHERSYANLWEVPGGSSDASDPTILLSLEREVFEETGLKLKKVLRQVGNLMEFTTGWGTRQKKWAKLTFEIEVADIIYQNRHGTPATNHDSSTSIEACQSHSGEQQSGSDSESREIAVTTDPEEHQSFAWTSLKDLKTDKYAISTSEQRALMLEAFEG